MSSLSDPSLQWHTEPLVAISISHLRPSTRQQLADGTLSVNAYPNDYGGFIYVSSAGDTVPQESELAHIFAIAQRASIVWIKFDSDAEVVDGIPFFDDTEGCS